MLRSSAMLWQVVGQDGTLDVVRVPLIGLHQEFHGKYQGDQHDHRRDPNDGHVPIALWTRAMRDAFE